MEGGRRRGGRGGEREGSSLDTFQGRTHAPAPCCWPMFPLTTGAAVLLVKARGGWTPPRGTTWGTTAGTLESAWCMGTTNVLALPGLIHAPCGWGVVFHAPGAGALAVPYEDCCHALGAAGGV